MGESFHLNPDHHIEAQYDWAEGTFLQGGDKGMVFSRNPEQPSYTTAFVEAMPSDAAGGGFFRGEGATIAEAETDAWNKWQRSQDCPDHEWEARHYTNGGGICKHCKRFGSNVFTAEQLGQFCAECGVATLWGQSKDENEEDHWYCGEHMLGAKSARYAFLMALERDGGISEQQKTDLWMIRSMYKVEDDGTLSNHSYS